MSEAARDPLDDLVIVVPMAGRGQRFVDAGYDRPKPMIDVLGRPMLTWALEGLPLTEAARTVFLCLGDHLDDGLGEVIAQQYKAIRHEVIRVDAPTQGQACTVLLARDFIGDGPLLIHNVDTYVESDIAEDLRTLVPECDGFLQVFRGEGDHWSFARTDERGRVVEVTEKRRVSEWCSTGTYCFSRGSDFVAAADAMIAADDRTNGEFYVAPVYQRLIERGAEIRISQISRIEPMGTPAELDRFIASWRA